MVLLAFRNRRLPAGNTFPGTLAFRLTILPSLAVLSKLCFTIHGLTSMRCSLRSRIPLGRLGSPGFPKLPMDRPEGVGLLPWPAPGQRPALGE